MESALTPHILEGAQAEERAMDDVELRVQLERVHADCFGWAMSCCGRDRDDAEEVLQTVYLSVLDGRARYEARSSFRTWIFGVIRRTAASERRKAWLRGLLVEREAGRRNGGAGVVALDPFVAADAEVELASRRDGLHRALGRLTDRQREVLQLVFYHDLTVEEAAGVMRVSVGSARTHYARGKAKLAVMLGDGKEL
ncbi:MAG TPA: sigma-70 family RNA polymerase sigma factor [Gemmatimonadaceae bacterium]|jgi:RNA polymerase sigma-70 factor (ECF subfamily)|nr:sigma-70 family RNA polymerase sigma factor [Gemmatimonadaceae bacterium]